MDAILCLVHYVQLIHRLSLAFVEVVLLTCAILSVKYINVLHSIYIPFRLEFLVGHEALGGTM